MFHGLSMVFCVYHQHGLDTVVRKKTWYNRYNHHKSSIQWAIANSDVKIAHLPGGLRDHGSGCAARSYSLPGGGGCLV